MLLVPADHAIPDAQAFRDAVMTGAPAAADGQIVTFGTIRNRTEEGVFASLWFVMAAVIWLPGLALVSAVKGYELLLTMSEAVSVERRKILAAREDVPYLDQAQHLALADEALDVVRMIGDACVSAFFQIDTSSISPNTFRLNHDL